MTWLGPKKPDKILPYHTEKLVREVIWDYGWDESGNIFVFNCLVDCFLMVFECPSDVTFSIKALGALEENQPRHNGMW